MKRGQVGLKYGVNGTCQQCRTPTPFRIASAGSFALPKVWFLSHAKTHALYESAARAVSLVGKAVWTKDPVSGRNVRSTADVLQFGCRHCYSRSETASWLDIGNEKFLGPFCKFCIARNREVGHADGGEDASTCPIYVLRLGKGVDRTIRLFQAAIAVRDAKTALRKAEPVEEQLF